MSQIQIPTANNTEELMGHFRQLTQDQLVEAFKHAERVTVQGIMRMACAVKVMVENEWQLPQSVSNASRNVLLRIADGQVRPELYQKFAGRGELLQRVQMLPQHQQERIANNEPVDVVTNVDEHGPETRRLDPARLSSDQVKQVFAYEGGSTRVRDVAEQRSYFERRRSEQQHREAGPQKRYDRRRKQVYYPGYGWVKRSELAQDLNALES